MYVGLNFCAAFCHNSVRHVAPPSESKYYIIRILLFLELLEFLK